MSSLDSLIYRYLDDRSALTPDEFDALVEQLRVDPAKAIEVREQLMVDDLLAQRLAVDRGDFLAQVGQRIADYERGQDEIDDQVAELRALAEAEIGHPVNRGGGYAGLKSALAISAALLVAAVIAGPWLLKSGSEAVAKVVEVQGSPTVVQDGENVALKNGVAIITGERVTTPPNSAVTLEYADKSRITIAGGSIVELETGIDAGAKLVAIEHGEVRASVMPQKRAAMTLTTPHARAIVLGTELRLTVGERDTKLDVTKGKVLLDRLADGQSVLVEASQYAVASADVLHVRTLAWPDRREDLVYLYTPLETFGQHRPLMAARNPLSGNLRQTDLEPRGSAVLNEFTLAHDLSGGYLISEAAGADIVAVCRAKSELTLEAVFSPAAHDADGRQRIVALGDDGVVANWMLTQEGHELVFSLRPDAANGPVTLRFEPRSTSGPVHIAITYGRGLLTAYQNGKKVATQQVASGSFSTWSEGPLSVGADAHGRSVWKGEVEAIALHGRSLSDEEIATNARNYRLLQGRDRSR